MRTGVVLVFPVMAYFLVIIRRCLNLQQRLGIHRLMLISFDQRGHHLLIILITLYPILVNKHLIVHQLLLHHGHLLLVNFVHVLGFLIELLLFHLLI